MALTFNDRAGRFVNERGQFVAERTVRATIDQIADGASDRLAALSDRLLAGQVSLGEWQAEAMRTVKLSQLAATTIAHGGRAQMTPSRYLAVARDIKEQYRYLRQFAEQVADGRQPLNRTVVSRAAQYGQAARGAFARAFAQDQQARGYRFERNVIHSGESCSGCRSESARGLVPIGSLVPVGRRTCRSNCRCRIAYVRDAARAA